LDEYLKRDRDSRVGLEVFGSHGMLVVGGEVTSQGQVDIEAVARKVYGEIGYEDGLEVFTNVEAQSPDIALGVDDGGAGDQGIMYGYATAENPQYMPMPVVYAHEITKRLADLRRHDPAFSWLGPDGKSQVTMGHGALKAVVVSAQHSPEIEVEQIRLMLMESLLQPLFGDKLGEAEIHINPTGRFVSGGFSADTGLTGRKIMVDTYGGIIPHGGGAFSGKDSTKVDRSAAYMARYAAKNLVAGGYASKCLISVAYAIGRSEPVMLTARSDDGRDLTMLVRKYFDFRPQAISERLGLRRPIFRATATYGHFGRDLFPWEQVNRMMK
jgi:S-adenosylmethionine synthetase